jgi:cellulose synthase/poly-beta-1,6-N-acetylglucosamine synthase-like glycosyltransferase
MNLFLAILLCGIPGLVWAVTGLGILLEMRTLPKLSMLPATRPDLPKLSIVIAARNEAAKIEAAMRSLLAQDYPDYDIIAVNDRSEDATGEILDRLAATHPRLRVIHVEQLPHGWLGKNHALQEGLDNADGELVLFTDADVHFAPLSLHRSVQYLLDQQLDHLTTLPHLLNARPSMRVMLPAFSVFFLMNSPPWKIANPESDTALGVGAFNLVRRGALEHAGGFEPIRLRPDDDLMLGRLLKRNGCRPGYVLSDRQVAVEWYTTAGETIRGLEKNTFAHFNYSPTVTLLAMLGALYITFMPFIGLLLFDGMTAAVATISASIMLALAIHVARLIKLAPAWGLFFPLGSALIVYTVLRSMVLTLKRGGIVWRDTFYPLELLRSNRV